MYSYDVFIYILLWVIWLIIFKKMHTIDYNLNKIVLIIIIIWEKNKLYFIIIIITGKLGANGLSKKHTFFILARMYDARRSS